MEQKKIGAFIAACRKRQNLTQCALAEMLGVSDRSVSNWENGVCLPDAALYDPLCAVLQISLGELFKGEFAQETSAKDAAAENLLLLLERRLYDSAHASLPFNEFQNALKRMSEAALLMQSFGGRAEAVAHLVRETGLTQEECAAAYDFYIKSFLPPKE